MSEWNKTLVRRFYEEVENQGKLDVIEELFDPGFRDAYPARDGGSILGVDGVKQLVTQLRSRGDYHLTIEDLIAEGDKVVARLSTHWTHRTEYMGVPPTGREADYQLVEIFRVADGKLKERWVFVDVLPRLRAIGLVPSPVRS